MNRRSFLTRATAAAVGALTLDPEQLLWVPGKKTIFLPGVAIPPKFDLGQIVARTWEAVVADRQQGWFRVTWGDLMKPGVELQLGVVNGLTPLQVVTHGKADVLWVNG